VHALQKLTHGNENIEGGGDRRFEVFVEGQAPELNSVTRLVDRLICLNKHRVAFVHVAQLGGVLKLETSGSSHRNIVVAWTNVSDLCIEMQFSFNKLLKSVAQQ
jgi:hypothetical protein